VLPIYAENSSLCVTNDIHCQGSRIIGEANLMHDKVVDLEALRDDLSEDFICEFSDEKTLKITLTEVGDSSFHEGINTLHAFLTVHGWNAKIKCEIFSKPERTKIEKKDLQRFGMEVVDEGDRQYLVMKVNLYDVGNEKLMFLLSVFFDDAAEMQ
jgi:hypothetical protein